MPYKEFIFDGISSGKTYLAMDDVQGSQYPSEIFYCVGENCICGLQSNLWSKQNIKYQIYLSSPDNNLTPHLVPWPVISTLSGRQSVSYSWHHSVLATLLMQTAKLVSKYSSVSSTLTLYPMTYQYLMDPGGGASQAPPRKSPMEQLFTPSC